MPALSPALALLVTGCRAPDPAPTELDELAHFFMAQVHEQDHEAIREGAANLMDWYQGSGLSGEPTGGALSDLSSAEVQALDELQWSPNPKLAAGVYVVSKLSCDMDGAAQIALYEQQLELFPDNYASYGRTWHTDPDCYPEGACDAVDWTAHIQDNFVGNLATMTYELDVKLRLTRDEAGDPAIMLTRCVMPEKATDDLNSGGFEQSYHIETHMPLGSGTLHFYGLWNYGWFLDDDQEAADDDIWPNQYLKGLIEFEELLEELCVSGW